MLVPGIFFLFMILQLFTSPNATEQLSIRKSDSFHNIFRKIKSVLEDTKFVPEKRSPLVQIWAKQDQLAAEEEAPELDPKTLMKDGKRFLEYADCFGLDSIAYT
jgi:hypothetical protein